MTDVTLEDLAGSAGKEAAESASKEAVAESGESLMDLIKWADERGYLGPLVQSQFGDVDLEAADPAPDPGGEGGGSAPNAPPLTASNIAAFSDAIIEAVGDVPISKVSEFANQNPDQVDQIIRENT